MSLFNKVLSESKAKAEEQAREYADYKRSRWEEVRRVREHWEKRSSGKSFDFSPDGWVLISEAAEKIGVRTPALKFFLTSERVYPFVEYTSRKTRRGGWYMRESDVEEIITARNGSKRFKKDFFIKKKHLTWLSPGAKVDALHMHAELYLNLLNGRVLRGPFVKIIDGEPRWVCTVEYEQAGQLLTLDCDATKLVCYRRSIMIGLIVLALVGGNEHG